MVLGSVLPFGAQILLIPFCYIPLGIISNRGGGRGKIPMMAAMAHKKQFLLLFSGDGL